jgi:hypothetical protein
MDHTSKGFVNLIDRALEIANQRLALQTSGAPDSAPKGALENIIRALHFYRDAAVSGKLEASNGVVTTGLLREVADWGESSESELFRAVRAIERYHLENM